MKKNMLVGAWAVVAFLGIAGTAQAQYESSDSSTDAAAANEDARNIVDASESPLVDGSYLAILGTYKQSESDEVLDGSAGGTALLGYRNGYYGLEAGLGYTEDSNVQLSNFAANVLLYPFKSVPAYVLMGAGAVHYYKYPTVRPNNAFTGGDDFATVALQAGLGYVLPIKTSNYHFGIRAEVLYRVGDRFLERESDFDTDLNAPGTFKDVLFNIGLQLPLRRPAPPPPPPEAVALVAPVLICSDGLDNDGDGLIDYPSDPGCSSAEDDNEADPAQCSDGKDNDGDGLVDFPADKGCSAAEDNDEVDPCKTPEAGESVSLKGCGLGDVIVLRGVNFEFDKDRLTVNAKTILDNVAEELTAYPEITIELGGHTDAKGSDEYNQALSDRRAASVVSYLKGKDIAAERMTSAGYGETQPVADNETDEGRELNRRVELKITSGIAAGSATTVSDGSSTTVTEATSLEPAVEAPAADAPAAEAAPAEAAPAETPVAE